MININDGLLFVKDNDLTKNEVEVFIHLLRQNYTVRDLASFVCKSESNVHNVLFSLRTKGLVEFKDKTVDGLVLYGVVYS